MGSTRVKEGKVAEEEKAKPKEAVKPRTEVRKEIIRLANTDVEADKPLYVALTTIKGIGYTTSRAICTVGNFDANVKLSTLTEQDREKLEDIIYNPVKFGLPAWSLNRRKSLETGEDLHLIGSDLEVAKKFDIQKMIDLKTWKGVRHMYGMPVRGQRTRSSFRKGRTVGVVRKAIRIAMQKSGEGEKKKEEKK
jgi:small subunit ribosomal protein S13